MPSVLVTGGSRGLGKAAVEEFRRRGWKVYSPTRSEMELADPASIRDYCLSHAPEGTLDALVHCAGVNWPRSLGNTSEEEWGLMLQVNLTAFRQLVQILAPKLAGSRVLALGSIWALVSKRERSAYSAAKAGLLGLVRALALELGGQGTLVNAVCPGYIDTDMTRQNNSAAELAVVAGSIPLGRLGKPEEIAKFIVWLCSSENTYITGQGLVIDGGFVCQ